MKNIISKIFYVALVSILFTSCERDLETEGITKKITYYAVITLNGEQWNVVPVGGSWTDPGATATEGGVEIPHVVGGDVVDTSTPGVYTITYSAINKDGYSSLERRYIGVITPAAAAIDLTGKYKRNAGSAGVSEVKKIKDGLYSASNIGGTTPDIAVAVNFYHYEIDKINAPPQVVGGSLFYTTKGSVAIGTSYSWAVINSGYGDAVRTFVKQ